MLKSQNNLRILYSEKAIEAAVSKIQNDINEKNLHFGSGEIPVYICVLNGAFMFFSDLMKGVDEGHIDFIRAKSYSGIKQSEVLLISDIHIDITGRKIYLIDDIYDSGKTLKFLIKHLEKEKPKSIQLVTLFLKHQNPPKDLIYGIELENEEFLVGFGMNGVDGLGRNQPYVSGVEEDNN